MHKILLPSISTTMTSYHSLQIHSGLFTWIEKYIIEMLTVTRSVEFKDEKRFQQAKD